jgi:hypothetical protein
MVPDAGFPEEGTSPDRLSKRPLLGIPQFSDALKWRNAGGGGNGRESFSPRLVAKEYPPRHPLERADRNAAGLHGALENQCCPEDRHVIVTGSRQHTVSRHAVPELPRANDYSGGWARLSCIVEMMVSTGRYQQALDVVSDALRLLRQRRRGRAPKAGEASRGRGDRYRCARTR